MSAPCCARRRAPSAPAAGRGHSSNCACRTRSWMPSATHGSQRCITAGRKRTRCCARQRRLRRARPTAAGPPRRCSKRAITSGRGWIARLPRTTTAGRSRPAQGAPSPTRRSGALRGQPTWTTTRTRQPSSRSTCGSFPPPRICPRRSIGRDVWPSVRPTRRAHAPSS